MKEIAGAYGAIEMLRVRFAGHYYCKTSATKEIFPVGDRLKFWGVTVQFNDSLAVFIEAMEDDYVGFVLGACFHRPGTALRSGYGEWIDLAAPKSHAPARAVIEHLARTKQDIGKTPIYVKFLESSYLTLDDAAADIFRWAHIITAHQRR